MENAVTLANAGFMVFPLAEGAKIPVTRWRHGEAGERASCVVRKVREHWTAHPQHNVGIDCGESELLVIDLDSDEAADRWDVLWDAREEHPWDDGWCPVVGTPRGWHLYLDQPDQALHNTVSLLGDGIDTRGDGGMVVAPGSVVKDSAYTLVAGDLAIVPPCPGWLAEALRPDSERVRYTPPVIAWPEGYAVASLTDAQRRVATKCEPGRNDMLDKQAFRLRPALAALGYELIETALFTACEQNGLAAGDGAASVRATIKCGLTAR
jgi:hypothetical protein